MLVLKQSDWVLTIFNQSKCLKINTAKSMPKFIYRIWSRLGSIGR